MNIKFSKDHEWVSIENNEATIGITNFAQEQLGDIVFVEMPSIGYKIEIGNEVGVVESVKAASDLFSPISGTVTEINDELEANPALLNSHPETTGWIFKITMSNPNEFQLLMDQSSYESFLETLQ